jgi:hypothetical protein
MRAHDINRVDGGALIEMSTLGTIHAKTFMSTSYPDRRSLWLM